jgi:copper chaperone CopZ
MIGKIKLATSAQILGMAVAWLAACMGIDFTFNRHLWTARPEVLPTTSLALRINHLCCTGCLDDVKKALQTLPWLKDAPMNVREGSLKTQEEAEVAGPAADYGGWLDIDVKDVSQIDFVAIDRALRDEGMVASQMQFGGVRHFRFEAQVRHMCCGMCKDACERMPELARTRQSGRLKWLDSVVAERATGKVTIHARYLEPDQRIDAAQLMGAMDEIGLPPFSLRVVVSAEEQSATAPIR